MSRRLHKLTRIIEAKAKPPNAVIEVNASPPPEREYEQLTIINEQ
jgi:hypothetical protein